MKRLSEFVSYLSPRDVLHFQDAGVSGVFCMPEASQKRGLYCVVDEFLQYGHWVRGSDLLEPALAKGASALLLEEPRPDIGLPQIIVPDARKSMAHAAKYFFDTPDEAMKIVGVTGTNGKTTITHLIDQLISANKGRSAALGTLGLFTQAEKYADTTYTTSLSPTLFETLDELRDMDVSTLSMEISSHALKLDRVFGLDVDIAVFTNLTRDHLDFHETMEDYQASKTKLFTRLKPNAVAVVNRDDPLGKELISLSPCPVIDYGCSPQAALRAESIVCSPNGTVFRICHQGQTSDISTSLVGDFNVYNVLAAFGVCLALGMELDDLQNASPCLKSVPGRVQNVSLPGARVGIVDYAHTPDSLEKVLHALRATGSGRIITVFGCGGDRDRGKRPLMGEVAARLSDLCVVTWDNPRREDPGVIIKDILAGMPEQGVVVEPDRRKAIRGAYEMSDPGDIILVAGKGHEPYQIIGDEIFPFDDREELEGLSFKG